MERRVRLRHDRGNVEDTQETGRVKQERVSRKENKYFAYDEIAVPDDSEFSQIFRDDYLRHFHHFFARISCLWARAKTEGREQGRQCARGCSSLQRWH